MDALKSFVRSNSKIRWIQSAVIVFATFGIASLAAAETTLHTLTGSGSQTVTGPALTLVTFEGGDTSLDLTVAVTSSVAIFFSGECTVAAPDDTTWLDVDIRVDGVALAPTSGNNAFCTSESASSLSRGWHSGSADAVGTLSPGAHTIDVSAALMSATSSDQWRMGETTLFAIVMGEGA